MKKQNPFTGQLYDSTAIVEDKTPQLGGDLDTNGKDINAISQTNAIENKSKLLQIEDIISDFVVSGLLPVTSVNLTSDIGEGKAYVTGTRVVKAVTPKTYTASRDTYVDINSVGTYTFVEVSNGATTPSVTSDSIRLAKVVTDTNNITGVTDLRELKINISKEVLFDILTLSNTGLHLLDTDASHDLIIAPGSNLTADRTLTITTGDASRTLTLSNNVTLDQDVDSTSSPTFVSPTINTSVTGTAFLDEDNMASNSADKFCSQQSIKAYADAVIPSGTEMLFYQDTAPVGWTINNYDDKLVFVSKGSAAGGETGGGVHSTGTWTQPDHTHTADAHTHQIPIGVSGTNLFWPASPDSGDAFSASYYTTNVTSISITPGKIKTDAASAATMSSDATANTWRPAAYVCIICTKN
jgi:hypothetical protein